MIPECRCEWTYAPASGTMHIGYTPAGISFRGIGPAHLGGMPVAAETVARPFEAIPVAAIPDDYPRIKPAILARMVGELGPIFALDWSYGRVVYMVGPEANRFILGSHREHFSHDLGWTPI